MKHLEQLRIAREVLDLPGCDREHPLGLRPRLRTWHPSSHRSAPGLATTRRDAAELSEATIEAERAEAL
jgi:hypothetical protein